MEEKYSWPEWETVRLIGRGSFGGVYEIRRDVFGHEEKAAMKVITIPQNDSDAEELFDSGYDEQSVTETFRSHLESIVNEYTLMRQMNGAANVVNCDDFRIVEHEGRIGWDILIKMELLTPLTRAVGREPPEEQVRRIAHDLCSALVLCKKYGIIHRDIKPQNIFVSQNGDYKLGDFGIAKTVEKTSGGTKIGTYKYMAPEVYNNKPYNLTADIYSLGLVLHWLLNERRSPFMPLPPTPATAALEDEARARRFAGEPIPAPAHGSEGLKRIVLKACAYDPKARYQSAEEMLRDVEALSAPVPAAAKPEEEDAPTELPTAQPVEEDTVSSPAPKRETVFRAQPAVQPDAPEAEPNRNYPKPEDRTVTVQTPPPAPSQGAAAAPAPAPSPAPIANPAPAPKKKKAIWPLLAALAAVLALVVGAVFLLNRPAPAASSDTASAPAGGNDAAPAAEAESYEFPLAEKAEIAGLISFPVGTESEPNNRTIFKRLEEQTNVHVNWTAYPGDQWYDRIPLEMANVKTLPDFVFSAGFSDIDLQKYAGQGVIIPLEECIDAYMPNLSKVFEQYPEYRAMCTDENGHIWALPWIEQLGYEKTAIETVGNMPFINVAWLEFLGLDMPTTVDEFKDVLIAFRDNADALKAEFGIDGDIIPMSCIIGSGNEDCRILTNGFGEGYGDPDDGRHIVVDNDGKVICSAMTEGWRKGVEWLHGLYEEGLIDPDAFTQEWRTYVAKGKSGRYGVCFSWDVANIAQVSMDDLIAGKGWAPLPALTADVRNITPVTGSYTSGFDRGRCVITLNCKNPALVCAWLDQMYVPIQSPQNEWGTYGEDDDFDIFEMSENDKGEPMLKHAWLGDASPVEVREAEAVGGPLAILDSYYGVYVTCPDDAQYRLDWIKDVYAPDMNTKYVYPNVFMSADDTKTVANLNADIFKCINSHRADWIMNGFTDADWDAFVQELQAYHIDEYLAIYQKYFDAFNAAA